MIRLAIAALLIPTQFNPTQPPSPQQQAAAIARPGIVLVTVTWHGWVRDRQTGEFFGGKAGYERKTTCTGAIIDPAGYVATASHCVHTGLDGGGGLLVDAAIADLSRVGRTADPAKAKKSLTDRALTEGSKPDTPVDRRITVERMVPDGKRDVTEATVVDLVAPNDGDVAVLRIPQNRLPSLELRPDDAPVGTPVLAIGYPGSAPDQKLAPSTKNGEILASRTVANRPFYEFRAAAATGMSGGPVVDTQGRVLGLISRRTPGESQSANLASSVTTLKDLLRGKGINVGLGPHDRNYRTGLDRYHVGDHNSAVDYFDATLAGSPTHLQAADFRGKAVDQGGVASSGNDVLTILAYVSGGILVVALTLGVLLVRRIRRRRGFVPPVPLPPSPTP